MDFAILSVLYLLNFLKIANKMLNQCWLNVGPTPTTLEKHQTNDGSMICVAELHLLVKHRVFPLSQQNATLKKLKNQPLSGPLRAFNIVCQHNTFMLLQILSLKIDCQM